MAEAIKRLANENRHMQNPKNRVCDYYAAPLEDNIYIWHFTIRGPSVNGKNAELAYKEGIYHGSLRFPMEYPFAPPDIIFFTPNGRFKLHQRICSTISSFHKELWRPTYDIGLILTALRLFMGQEDEIGVGAMTKTSVPENEKRHMAAKSWDYVCDECHHTVRDIWHEHMEPFPPTTGEKMSQVPELPPSTAPAQDQEEAASQSDGPASVQEGASQAAEVPAPTEEHPPASTSDVERTAERGSDVAAEAHRDTDTAIDNAGEEDTHAAAAAAAAAKEVNSDQATATSATSDPLPVRTRPLSVDFNLPANIHIPPVPKLSPLAERYIASATSGGAAAPGSFVLSRAALEEEFGRVRHLTEMEVGFMPFPVQLWIQYLYAQHRRRIGPVEFPVEPTAPAEEPATPAGTPDAPAADRPSEALAAAQAAVARAEAVLGQYQRAMAERRGRDILHVEFLDEHIVVTDVMLRGYISYAVPFIAFVVLRRLLFWYFAGSSLTEGLW